MDAPQLDYGDMVMAQMAQRLEAIEAENAQLRELCREAYRELNCGDEGDVFDRTHFCGICDSSIDRNGTLRGKLALAFVMVPNAS